MKKDKVSRIFSKIPVLETPRLILRRLRTDDYKDMYEYAKQDIVTQYLTWTPHPDEEYTYEYLQYLQTQYRSGDFYDWAVTLKQGKKMIGTCGFTRFHLFDNGAEIGYVLNPQYWGKGYIPEAVQTVLKFGFMELNLHRIEAKYIRGNTKSCRVMEKCGMTYEGMYRSSLYIKEEYKDIGVYSILSEEYIHRYL